MSLRATLTQTELKQFTQRSDAKGVWLVAFNWGLICLAFSLPLLWSSPLAIVLAVIVLANRQLGLAILMHECAHSSLFATRSLNKWVGNILCAAPVFADLEGYRKYHMRHHKEAGTTTDPDYPNYKNYPVSRASMVRKILRDLTGITAIKTFYAVMLMNAGLLNYDMAYRSHSAEKKLPAKQILVNLITGLALPAIVHLCMFGALATLGHAWLYALWWVSYATVYMLFLRIRNAAEHGNVPDLLSTDPTLHARTTKASWWERLSVAPNYVNFHMEHHLRPSVPCYQLPKFHQYLESKGVIKQDHTASGYIDVLRQLVAR